MNKKPGDKIPTKIKEKHAARTKGGETEEMREENKKPGDKIPNKIKERQAARTQGGEIEERSKGNKKSGDKIPNQIKTKQVSKKQGEEVKARGEKSKKPWDEIPTQMPTTQGGNEKISRIMSDSVLNGERAFVFSDENKMYRFVQTPKGYTCPICKMEFARIGQHISTKQCGDEINIDKFKEALKRYQKNMCQAKQKEKDLATFSEKNRKRVAKSENKRKFEDLDLFVNKNKKKSCPI